MGIQSRRPDRKPSPLLTGLLLLVAVGRIEARAPTPVSPGDPAGVPSIEQACPTFTWGLEEPAEFVELVVYKVEPGRESDMGAPSSEPAIQVVLPGAAHAWTPSLDRCLGRGRRYAWSVRSTGGEKPSEWSEASFFQVAGGPTLAELAQALGVLQKILASEAASDPGTRPTASRPSHAGPSTASMAKAAGAGPAASIATAEAAFHAEHPATVGEAAGLRAVTHTADGVAGVFENTAGPPFVGRILSGLSDGVEVFSVDQSGDVAAASFAGDGSALTNVTPAPDSVGVNELSANAVTSAKILNGTILGLDILDGTVTSADIGNGTIVSADIANGTITHLDVQDGTLGGADIADGSVTGADIANGSITGADIANGSITGVHISAGSIVGTDIASLAITGAKIANSTITGIKIADNAINTDHVANDAIGKPELKDIKPVWVDCFMTAPCDDVSLGQVCDVAGAGWKPISVACSIVSAIPFPQVTCGGIPGGHCRTGPALGRATQLGSFCDNDDMAFDAIVYCMDD